MIESATMFTAAVTPRGIVRHGFPDDPRCLAFDPVQKLVAIGASHGEVRLLGQPGVDYFLKHESDEPVVHVQFLINEGGLITVQRDDTIHLWTIRQKTPEIVHSMQMSKERVTCIYVPFQSKWLYIGTDKGNVYFVCLANFELSTYVINWNKAIDLSCRIHPGSVKHLSLCPTEAHRLLIGFEKSHVSLWNLQTREAEQFAVGQPQIRCISWHHDGKQFMCGHVDGSLTIWNLRKSTEPQQKINPHITNSTCRPITNLMWQHNAEGEQLVAFVGGLPADDGALPAVSIMRGRPTKSTVVAEMDHSIVAITALNVSPFTNVPQHPYGIAVLLKSDFIIIDLHAQGFCCFENPYSFDLHESPITYINYFSDCPVDLIAALTLVGRNQRKQGVKMSERPWPITGGLGRECATGHQEMLITGHEDGSLKFWQASSENLQVMYKLKTGRHFEKIDENKVVSYAITDVVMCLDSRLLLIAGACGQVTLFRFVKTESSQDIAVVTLSQLCSSNRPLTPLFNDEESKSGSKELRRQLETSDSRSTATSTGSDSIEQTPIRVRGGSMRRPAGYQPELVCQIPWVSGTTPEIITSMALNSVYGVLAIGTITGVALVDIISYTQIYTWANTEICNRDPIPLSLPPQNSEASPSEPQTPTISTPDETRSIVGLFRRATADLGNSRRPPKKLSLKPLSFDTNRPPTEAPPPLTIDTSVRRPSTLAPMSAGCNEDTLLPPNFPSRSHSVKKIVRRVTDRLKRAKSFQVTMEEPPEDHIEFPPEPRVTSRLQSMHSSMAASPVIPSSGKNFMRLNTEKSRSVDRRPILAKAQSIAASAAAAISGSGSEVNSPLHFNNGIEFSNGESPRNINGGSRSPSLSSLEKINALPDFVTSLSFITCSSKRNQSKAEPCLWLGLSGGASVAFSLQLPNDRITNSVVAAPSDMYDGPKGSVIRLQDRIICTAFLDRNMCIIAGPSEAYRDPTKDSAPPSANIEKAIQNKVLTRTSLSPTLTNPEAGLPPPEELAQLAIFVCESEAKIIALPSYQQVYQYRPEIPFVIAKPSHVRGYPVLMCLNGASQIVVLSLPSLRPLSQQQLFRGSVDVDDPICKRTEFSEHGLGVYAASPSEIQKFTVCSDLAAQVSDCSGELFVPMESPEPPKTSFLRGVSTLFASQKDSVDLDTLFSEKPSTVAVAGMKSVARTLPVNNLDPIHSRNITAGQAAAAAIQNLNERGERLNAVVDTTENLRNNALNLQSRTSKLVEKYEKKKWYQL